MELTDQQLPAPRWFTIAAIAALLWEILGCYLYYMRVTIDRAALPTDQIRIFDATPTWVLAAFAIAVWVGLAGAILLVMRRRLAEPLLAISLVALAVQNSAFLLVPALRNLTSSDDLLLPVVILVVCYGIWHLARLARRSGWLR